MTSQDEFDELARFIKHSMRPFSQPGGDNQKRLLAGDSLEYRAEYLASDELIAAFPAFYDYFDSLTKIELIEQGFHIVAARVTREPTGVLCLYDICLGAFADSHKVSD